MDLGSCGSVGLGDRARWRDGAANDIAGRRDRRRVGETVAGRLGGEEKEEWRVGREIEAAGGLTS